MEKLGLFGFVVVLMNWKIYCLAIGGIGFAIAVLAIIVGWWVCDIMLLERKI